jgi:hypothetical protein
MNDEMTPNEDDCSSIESGISEANAETPRRVRFDETNTRVVCGALLVFLIGFVGYAWISYSTLTKIRIRDILHREGSTTDGIVTVSKLNHSGVYLYYRYEVDGVRYFGQVEMKASGYRAPAPGETIHILYLPSKPNVSLPSGWEWFSIWDIVPLVFVLFTTTGSGFLIAEALRERQLARMGVVVEGRVTGCELSQRPFKIYYEFTTDGNGVAEGSSELADEYEVGAPIPVIYLRSNPKRNDRYPPSGFRIAD